MRQGGLTWPHWPGEITNCNWTLNPVRFEADYSVDNLLPHRSIKVHSAVWSGSWRQWDRSNKDRPQIFSLPEMLEKEMMGMYQDSIATSKQSLMISNNLGIPWSAPSNRIPLSPLSFLIHISFSSIASVFLFFKYFSDPACTHARVRGVVLHASTHMHTRASALSLSQIKHLESHDTQADTLN